MNGMECDQANSASSAHSGGHKTALDEVLGEVLEKVAAQLLPLRSPKPRGRGVSAELGEHRVEETVPSPPG